MGLTELEIFTQRRDLFFAVGPLEENPKKFGLMISRSECHRYKPLLSGGKFDDKESAINQIEKILNVIIDHYGKDLSKSLEGTLTGYSGLNENEISETETTLTKDDVTKIITTLREKGSCDTKDWKSKNASGKPYT